MFEGDIETIATGGFNDSETKEVIIAMAKEIRGSRKATWSAIHRIERVSSRILTVDIIISTIVLITAIFLLIYFIR